MLNSENAVWRGGLGAAVAEAQRWMRRSGDLGAVVAEAQWLHASERHMGWSVHTLLRLEHLNSSSDCSQLLLERF